MRSFRGKVSFPWRTAILFFAVALAITVSFCLWGDAIDLMMRQALASSKSAGIAAVILYLVLASDIILPIPSCLAGTMCGVMLGPTVGFLVSFFAMNTSAAIGFVLGKKAADPVKRFIGRNDAEFLERIHKKGRWWLILGLRPVPVLSEASLIFAGFSRLRWRDVAVPVLAGNCIVSAVYVFSGAYFSAEKESSFLAFAVSMVAAGVFMATCRIYDKLQSRGKVQ
jgi:uncharacterized membrane protein YdjX (TVP38/TMEM64 family)